MPVINGLYGNLPLGSSNPKEIAKVISDLIEKDTEEAPNPSLLNLDVGTITPSEAISTGRLDYTHSQTTPIFEDALSELDKLRSQFDAKQDFERPYISKKYAFNLPLGSVKAWVMKGLRKGWDPKIFFVILAELLGVSLNEKNEKSRYSYISLTLQAFAAIKQNKEYFLATLQDKNVFRKQTDLIHHAGVNDPGMYRLYFDLVTEVFEKEYLEAKKAGQLEQFFSEAFNQNNICFEARARHFENYVQKKNTSIDLDFITNHKPDENLQDYLAEELKVLGLQIHKNGQHRLPTEEEFKEFLQKRDVFHAQVVEEGVKRNIDQASIDRVCKVFIEEFILDE